MAVLTSVNVPHGGAAKTLVSNLSYLSDDLSVFQDLSWTIFPFSLSLSERVIARVVNVKLGCVDCISSSSRVPQRDEDGK